MLQEIQFILYNLPEKEGKVQVIIRDETLWCTQKAMAQLFGVDRTVVSKHLKNIFESAELQQDSVCAKFAHTAEDGKIYNTQFYNLDAVISVGYRVNSLQATRFRQWTTKILNEYIKKGFVLNDDRLKQGETVFGQDYFQELLERIRSIRASERRIWQKITDIYAECSIDYDKDSPTTHDFYAMIQNRFHYAYRADGSRNCVSQCGSCQRAYGFDYLEELSQWTYLKIGCYCCKELSAREKDKGIGACCISILRIY